MKKIARTTRARPTTAIPLLLYFKACGRAAAASNKLADMIKTFEQAKTLAFKQPGEVKRQLMLEHSDITSLPCHAYLMDNKQLQGVAA